MRDDLRPFSFVVLALVGSGGAGAHDIVTMMRRGRPYWAAAESHYYAEPKRLASLGYLAARSEAGRTTERRVYSLTARGEEALREWIAEPTPFPRIQNEAVVRVLAAEHAEPEALLASLDAMRVELDAVEDDLRANLRAAEDLPHRARSIRLATELGRGLVEAHRAWLDRVAAEFAEGEEGTGAASEG